MAEYISLEALLTDIDETVIFSARKGTTLPTAEMRGANKVIDRIKSAPTAYVVEVRNGEWVCVNESDNVWMCDGEDGCGGEIILLEGTPIDNEMVFCPPLRRNDGWKG